MLPSVRHALVAAAAAGCAVALSVQGTLAAFTSTTSTAGSFSAGSVWLDDDDAQSALIAATGLEPGDSHAACLRVTYDGTMDAEVRLWASYYEGDPVGDGAVLDANLDLTVQYDTVTTGSPAGCGDFSSEGTLYTGTLQALAAAHTGFGDGAPLGSTNGATPWTPAPGEVRVFRITYGLAANAPSAVQGDFANATFTWEAQSS